MKPFKRVRRTATTLLAVVAALSGTVTTVHAASPRIGTNGNGNATDVGTWFVTYNNASMWADNFGKGFPIKYRPLDQNGGTSIPDSGNPAQVDFYLAELAEAGIDFVLLDETNGGFPETNYGTGNRWIVDNAKLVAQRISAWNTSHSWKLKYAMAVGIHAAPCKDEVTGRQDAKGLCAENHARSVWNNFAQNDDDYYTVDGKPLLVLYDFASGDPLQAWAGYTGDKTNGNHFTVRGADASSPGQYGWQSPNGTQLHPEVEVVSPGWNNHNGNGPGTTYSRANGNRYQSDWDKVLTNPRPRIVMIQAFNDYNEDSAIWTADTSAVDPNHTEAWRGDDGALHPSQYWDATVAAIASLRGRETPDLAVGATGRASSPYQDFPASNLTDGNRASVYSSTPSDTDHTEWAEVALPARTRFNKVTLISRGDGPYGFPRDFQIQVWNGSDWVTRVTRAGFPAPSAGTAVSFTWDVEDKTNRVRVLATGLGVDDNNHRVLQLGGFEVTRLPGATARPQTVPALREWTAAAGAYTFGAAARIVLDPAAPALADEGETFAADLAALTGVTVPVVRDTAANLRAGDLFLGLGSTDTALGDEGYTMTVGAAVQIRARTDAGAYYGTRSILQVLRQSGTIPAGTARDWPTKSERGLMIDTGRKFFTVDWIKNHIKDLGYLKLNYFHLHLSDTFGFRLESSSHPEVVSPDHYTKAQLAELIALGARHHVTIVPEVDMPGHMNQVLANHPELQLDKPDGSRNPYYLDLSEPGAYTLASDLINEYLPLFPAKYWHLGADEYIENYGDYPQLLAYARAKYGPNATAKDTYYGFINWANGLVRSKGKTMRMWNDGIKAGDGTINPASDIMVEYWINVGLTPQQLLDRGHTISNESLTPTYYTLGAFRPDSTWTYQDWTPDWFQGNNLIKAPARNLGSKMHIWADNPGAETEDQIAGRLFLHLRVLAQQTWGSPKLTSSYGEFSPIAAAINHAPGWPVVSDPGNRALHRPVTVSANETADFPGQLAVDGDPNTRWSGGLTDPSWIQVDLGERLPISRVAIRWEQAYARKYQIQVSDDASNWTTIYATATGDGAKDDLTGLAGAGRYIRLKVDERATTWLSLWEFEVYSAAPQGLSGTYQLTAAGKALDDPASSLDPGKPLEVWAPHGGPNQRWTLSRRPDGAYTLVNGASGLCADVTGSSGASGAAVVQWTCTGTDNQAWLVQASGNTYKLIAKHSGLSLTGGATDGTAVTQQTDTASASQRWALTPA